MSEAALTANIAMYKELAVGMADFHWCCMAGSRGVALAMHAAMDVKPHLQPETFRWDVALHQAPDTESCCCRGASGTRVGSRRTSSPRNQCLRPSRVLRERRFPRSWSGQQSFKRFRLRKSPTSSRTLRPSGAPVGRDREVQPVASRPVETMAAHAQEILQQTNQDAVPAVEAQSVTAELSETMIHEAVSRSRRNPGEWRWNSPLSSHRGSSEVLQSLLQRFHSMSRRTWLCPGVGSNRGPPACGCPS